MGRFTIMLVVISLLLKSGFLANFYSCQLRMDHIKVPSLCLYQSLHPTWPPLTRVSCGPDTYFEPHPFILYWCLAVPVTPTTSLHTCINLPFRSGGTSSGKSLLPSVGWTRLFAWDSLIPWASLYLYAYNTQLKIHDCLRLGKASFSLFLGC